MNRRVNLHSLRPLLPALLWFLLATATTRLVIYRLERRRQEAHQLAPDGQLSLRLYQPANAAVRLLP